MAAAGGALKHWVMSFHGQPGALSWLANTEVLITTSPVISFTPCFFSMATILRIFWRFSVGSPEKRATRSPLSTPSETEPGVSRVVVNRKSGPNCNRAARAVRIFIVLAGSAIWVPW
ncbi:hypothetical protein D3C80_1252550 [compost metagenome]